MQVPGGGLTAMKRPGGWLVPTRICADACSNGNVVQHQLRGRVILRNSGTNGGGAKPEPRGTPSGGRKGNRPRLTPLTPEKDGI
jgi:hypothetical protein